MRVVQLACALLLISGVVAATTSPKPNVLQSLLQTREQSSFSGVGNANIDCKTARQTIMFDGGRGFVPVTPENKMHLKLFTIMAWIKPYARREGDGILGNYKSPAKDLPGTCKDIYTHLEATNQHLEDGEYTLYHMRKRTAKWTAFCYKMSGGNPLTYLSLSGSGAFDNSSVMKGVGGGVVTKWNKVRIDPETLEIDGSDLTFATSNGHYTRQTDLGLGHHNPKLIGSFAAEETFDKALDIGETMVCCVSSDPGCPTGSKVNSGVDASLNLRGTPFIVDLAEGLRWQAVGTDNDDRMRVAFQPPNEPTSVTITGAGGHCSTVKPVVPIKLKVKSSTENQDDRGSGYGFMISPTQELEFRVAVGDNFQEEDGGAKIRGPLMDRQWSHVAATFDGQSAKLFINGNEVGAAQASGTVHYAQKNPFWIGRLHHTFFKGEIAEFAVYDFPMEMDEIRELKDQPQEGDEHGLVKYMRLNSMSYPGISRGTKLRMDPWPCKNTINCKRISSDIKRIFHRVTGTSGVPINVLWSAYSLGMHTNKGQVRIKEKLTAYQEKHGFPQELVADCAKKIGQHWADITRKSAKAFGISYQKILAHGETQNARRKLYMAQTSKHSVPKRFETLKKFRELLGMKGSSEIDKQHQAMKDYKDQVLRQLEKIRALQKAHDQTMKKHHNEIRKDTTNVEKTTSKINDLHGNADALQSQLQGLKGEVEMFWKNLEKAHVEEDVLTRNVARVGKREKEENLEEHKMITENLHNVGEWLDQHFGEMKNYTEYQFHVLSDMINKTQDYVDEPLAEAFQVVSQLEHEHKRLRADVHEDNSGLSSEYHNDMNELKRTTDQKMYLAIESVGRRLDRQIDRDVRHMTAAAKQWMKNMRARKREKGQDPPTLARQLSEKVSALVKQGLDVKRATQQMESMIDKNSDEMKHEQSSVQEELNKVHIGMQTQFRETRDKIEKVDQQFDAMRSQFNDMLASSQHKAERVLDETNGSLKKSVESKQTETQGLLTTRISQMEQTLKKELDKMAELSEKVKDLEDENDEIVEQYAGEIKDDKKFMDQMAVATRELKSRVPTPGVEKDRARHLLSRMKRACERAAYHEGTDAGIKIGEQETEKAFNNAVIQLNKTHDICKKLMM